MTHRRRGLIALAGTLGMIATTFAFTTSAGAAAHFIETSHTVDCGTASITLRNVSPWIYPVSVEIDGAASFGPTVDNRTDTDGDGDLDVNGPQKDMSRTRVITFAEDSGTHTVRYRVAAGTENDLYVGLPVGQWTEFTVDSNCIANVPPTATITTPANGATYFVGQPVTADYSCADSDGTVATCIGTVAAGAAVDTATPGAKAFSVTATDDEGATGSASAAYTVVPLSTECSGRPVNLANEQLDLGSTIPKNGSPAPCVTRTNRVATVTTFLGPVLPFPLTALSGTVKVTLIEGKAENAGSTVRGSSKVESVEVSLPLFGWYLQARNLVSSAEAIATACGAPATLNGTAEVGKLVNQNRSFDRLTKPWSLTVPLVGTISANQVVKVGNKVTATALAIDLAGRQADTTYGESTAAVSC